MPVSQEVKAEIIAALGGGRSAGAVASDHGVSRNTVIGIWARQRSAAPAPGAAVAAPKAPARAKDVRLSGRNREAWAVLLAAGDAGATEAEIWGALRPAGSEEPGNGAVHALLCAVRSVSHPQGFTVVAAEKRSRRGGPTTGHAGCARARASAAVEARWRIVRVGDGSPAAEGTPVPVAAVPVASAAVPETSAIGCTVTAPPLPRPPIGAAPATVRPPARPPTAPPRAAVGAAVFSRTARAVQRLTARCCRWPIGDVGTVDFRFCCAATPIDGAMPYCAEHRRAASAGFAGRRVA